MATENIVLLACAAVLCTLHVVGGPLSGLFRKPPPRRRSREDEDEVGALAESDAPPPMANSEPEIISRAS